MTASLTVLEHAAGLSLSPSPSTEPELAFRTRDFCRPSSWSVYCNECDVAMNSTHFHCSVCDGGDYDLCQSCVDSGKLCPGEGHWLIKRTVVGGKFVSSTTELAAPKPRAQVESVESMPAQVESDKATAERDMPGTFTDDARTLNDEAEGTFRNCNNCIIGLPDHEFVTCAVCDDFDLCRRCYTDNKHGHHPAHGFAPAVPTAKLSAVEEALLTPGRNVFHNALCDGCEKVNMSNLLYSGSVATNVIPQNIRGIRHKCFTCPDFDYCNDCVKNARVTHPGHRFAQIYKPTAVARISFTATHHGVYCDGPLCNDKPGQSYIKGVRYKCVVCNDKDFCASCEALPGNTHNKTHPLVKFKTPVNHVTVSTQNETRDGKVSSLGDKDAAPKPTTPKPTTNVTTPVKTVADIEPSQKTMEEVRPYRTLASVLTENAALEAHFVKDDIVDGTAIESNATFTQAWTLRNPGPRAWPSGCSVRFVGGDHMLHVRPYCPAASNANEASESNVIWREVQPGEEVSFRVILKTPSREGKSISYWRVMTADGTPFGHKLWCDINVTSPLSLNATTEWYAARDDRTPLLAGYDERMAAMDRATLIRSMEEYLPKHKGTPKAPLPARASTKEEFVRRTMAAQTATSVDAPKAEASAKTDSAPAQTKTKAEARGQEEDEGETKDSQMIFPRLERESPSSSAYESFGPSATTTVKAAFVEDEESRAEVVDASLAPASSPEAASTVSSQKAKTSEEEFEDIFELEVLSADGDEASDEDGFMTDEEYDILDASDQETVASK